ncbi:hypothetical protein IAU59_005056 [Kwoniella sp. CBS 9459]
MLLRRNGPGRLRSPSATRAHERAITRPLALLTRSALSQASVTTSILPSPSPSLSGGSRLICTRSQIADQRVSVAQASSDLVRIRSGLRDHVYPGTSRSHGGGVRLRSTQQTFTAHGLVRSLCSSSRLKSRSPEDSPPKAEAVSVTDDVGEGEGEEYIASDVEDRERLWTALGTTPPLAQQLLKNYPHIRYPTPAQKLFILAVEAGKEVFLKDDMGRGKTLALAVAALNRALQSPSKPGVKIMIVVPTPYLAHQIYDHLLRLTPSSHDTDSHGDHDLGGQQRVQPQPRPDPDHVFAPLFTLLRPISSGAVSTTKTTSSLKLPDTPIVLSTAKDLTQYDLTSSSLSSLKYLFIDEPDTLLGPIPPRYYPPQLLSSHPINRHPPPIVKVLNTLLNIRPGKKGEMDFTRRYDHVNTIWTSASMVKDFKRVVKTRGWIKRGNKVVDLDFTETASDNAIALRDRLMAALPSTMRSKEEGEGAGGGNISRSGISVKQKDTIGHYALVVDPADGNISPLEPGATSLPSRPGPSSSDKGEPLAASPQQKKAISPYILESLALLHATSPPPPGRYALVLPPEGISLATIATELSRLGLPTLVLAPHLMQIGIDTSALSDSNNPDGESESADNREEPEGTPILLAQRSSVPGLHLKDLHTIYLLDGLDVGGLSQKQRKSGGVRDRFGFYELVSGRLGRFGTASSPQGNGGVHVQTTIDTQKRPSDMGARSRRHDETEPKQRVISLVLAGTEEEKRLGEMFLDKDEGTDSISTTSRKKQLSQWDLEGLFGAVEKEVGASSPRNWRAMEFTTSLPSLKGWAGVYPSRHKRCKVGTDDTTYRKS